MAGEEVKFNFGQPQQTIDLSALAEQLCRIEHKLDLLLEGAAQQNPYVPTGRQVGQGGHVCPVCGAFAQYDMDMFRGHVVRRCACKSGVVPGGFQLNPVPTQQGPTNE